jgi:NADH-quinone oxidoreductase subunit M
MIVLLGSIALPLTNGFVGEFLLLNGVYRYGPGTAVFAGTTVILGAIYMLRAYKRIMLGEDKPANEAFQPLHGSEKTLLVIVAALVLVTGVYPGFLTDIAGPSIDQLMLWIK